MNTTKINPRNILGGIPGLFDEDDFERETSLVSTITSAVASVTKDIAGGVYEAASDLSQTVIVTESKSESNGAGQFPATGSIEFNKEEIDRKKAFYQAIKEDTERTQRAKDKLLFEEEINDIATNLPTEQKNRLLHYQASYNDRSIYQRAELRKKLIEESKKAKEQEKAASIPNPAKQPSALEGAFEGRSGAQGSGTANLSAQAVG